MDNHFNTPAEVIDLSIKACENKTRLPLGKMILLGIMAGAFIAFGGATSSTAAHAVENVGVARALAGTIFPVGLMLIVFLGGELFTGNGSAMGLDGNISYIPPWLVIASMAFAVLIGMVAGYFPALRAMKLSPLAAIRNE